MNDINLIPDKVMYRKRYIFKNFLKGFGILILLLMVASLLLLRTYQRMQLDNKIQAMTVSVDTSQIQALNDAQSGYNAKMKEDQQIDKLLTELPQGNRKFTELLNKVLQVAPSAIALRGIDFGYESGELSLDFSAQKRSDISIFLKRLHDESAFVNITVSEITGTDPELLFTVITKVAGE